MEHVEQDVLRVKASSPPAPVASAISHALYDNKDVVVRAIGAGAVNQAVKALIIAQQYVSQRGLILKFRPGFATVQVEGKDVSAITFRVLID